MNNKQEVNQKIELFSLNEIVKLMNLLGSTKDLEESNFSTQCRDGYYKISFNTFNQALEESTKLDIKSPYPDDKSRRALTIQCDYYYGENKDSDYANFSIDYQIPNVGALELVKSEPILKGNDTFSVLKNISVEKLVNNSCFIFWSDKHLTPILFDWNFNPGIYEDGKWISYPLNAETDNIRNAINDNLNRSVFTKKELMNFEEELKYWINVLQDDKDKEEIKRYVKSLSPKQIYLLKSELSKRG